MPGSVLMALLTLIIKLFNVFCVGSGTQAPWSHREQQWNDTSNEKSCGKTSVQRPLPVLSPCPIRASALGVICPSMSRYLGMW